MWRSTAVCRLPTASSPPRTRHRPRRGSTRAPRRCAWRSRWRNCGAASMKSARRQSRELALQALYAWQVSGGDPMEEARGLEGFDKGDRHFVEALVAGVRDRVGELQGLIVPHLDRDLARLSPVERSILYIGALELAAHPETPFKVVLNEAIELGKSYGGTEGYRFVNGVLEKVAAHLRPDEVVPARNPAEPTRGRVRAHSAVLRSGA